MDKQYNPYKPLPLACRSKWLAYKPTIDLYDAWSNICFFQLMFIFLPYTFPREILKAFPEIIPLALTSSVLIQAFSPVVIFHINKNRERDNNLLKRNELWIQNLSEESLPNSPR